jgi:O-antigen/teichoic acid export membrane protein
METEDLKNRWLSLEEQLKKQEVFNEQIIKEHLKTKSDRALSRLISYEAFGAIVLLAGIPVIIYALGLKSNLSEYYIFLYCMTGVCVLGFFWQICKLHDLMQIDFSNTLSNNARYTNKYNVKIRKEKISMSFFVPVLLLPILYIQIKSNMSILFWAIGTCTFVFAIVFTYWSYKRLYDKNIASILKSLEELKELEE